MRADHVATSRLKAFSLIEVLVVLAVLATMAATVSISLSGVRNQATTENVIMRLSQFDQSMRTHARRFGEGQNLAIDLDRKRLMVNAINDSNESDSSSRSIGSGPTRTLALPNGYDIKRVITATSDIAYGKATIRYSSEGWTPIYALLLTDSTDATFWLVMNGFGGPVERLEATDTNEQSILGLIRDE